MFENTQRRQNGKR